MTPQTRKGPSPISATVARHVRELREARGWSVRQLADQCGRHDAPYLTAMSLANIERGQATTDGDGPSRKGREITVDELYVFARVFAVSVERLTEVSPTCHLCAGFPPPGFTCQACGEGGTR